jgi:hypothetical protein
MQRMLVQLCPVLKRPTPAAAAAVACGDALAMNLNKRKINDMEKTA